MRTAEGFEIFKTSLGECLVIWSHEKIVGFYLPQKSIAAMQGLVAEKYPGLVVATTPRWVQKVIERVRQHLEGAMDDFRDVPLDLDGVPPFHQKVYRALRETLPGQVTSYGELALQAGSPGAARAVGQAMGRNPFALLVPCHRVVGARVAPGGFTAFGGLVTKKKMLANEGVALPT